MELSKDLSWVVCYVLLSDEHECVCAWEGMVLVDVKSRKPTKNPPFCFLPTHLRKNVYNSKDLKKYLRHQEKNRSMQLMVVTSSDWVFSHEWGACEASQLGPLVSNRGWAEVATFLSGHFSLFTSKSLLFMKLVTALFCLRSLPPENLAERGQ